MPLVLYSVRKPDFALLKFADNAWAETGATAPTDMLEHGLISTGSEMFLWCWRAGGMQMYRWDGAALALAASLPGAPRPCGAPTMVNTTVLWPASTRRPTPNACIAWNGKTLVAGSATAPIPVPVPDSTRASFAWLTEGTTTRIVPRGGVQYPDGSIVFWSELTPAVAAWEHGQLLTNASMSAHRFGLLNPADGPAVLAARRAIDTLAVTGFDHLGMPLRLCLDWTLRDVDGAIVWTCPAARRAATVSRKVADTPFDWLGAAIEGLPGARVIGVDSSGNAVAAYADGSIADLPDTFTALGGLGGDLGARPATEVAVRPCMATRHHVFDAASIVIGGSLRSNTELGATTPTYRLAGAKDGSSWTVGTLALSSGSADHAAVEASYDLEGQRLHVLALNRASNLWHHYAVEDNGVCVDLGVAYRHLPNSQPGYVTGSSAFHRVDGTDASLTVVGADASQLTVAVLLRGPAGHFDVTVTLAAAGDQVSTATSRMACSPSGLASLVTLAHSLPSGTPYTLGCRAVRV
jgi:hypothetical protein